MIFVYLLDLFFHDFVSSLSAWTSPRLRLAPLGSGLRKWRSERNNLNDVYIFLHIHQTRNKKPSSITSFQSSMSSKFNHGIFIVLHLWLKKICKVSTENKTANDLSGKKTQLTSWKYWIGISNYPKYLKVWFHTFSYNCDWIIRNKTETRELCPKIASETWANISDKTFWHLVVVRVVSAGVAIVVEGPLGIEVVSRFVVVV